MDSAQRSSHPAGCLAAPPAVTSQVENTPELPAPLPTEAPTPEFPDPTTGIAPPETQSFPTELIDPPTPDLTSLPPLPSPTSTPEISVVNTAPILYYAQAADTLRVVAVRFGVKPTEISSPEPIPETTFINPGQLLIIPRRLSNTTSSQHILPDSEVVFSPSAVNFNVQDFADQAGGYLKSFDEWHKSTGNAIRRKYHPARCPGELDQPAPVAGLAGIPQPLGLWPS